MSRSAPLAAQIEDRIARRLATVTRANGYAWPVHEVHRRAFIDERPRLNGVAEIAVDPEGFEQDDDLIDSLGIKVQRSIGWNVDYWMEVADGDDRPLSTLQFEALADIERALEAEITPHETSQPFGGLAYLARLLQPSFIQTSGGESVGVRVRLLAQIRYLPADPYRAANG